MRVRRHGDADATRPTDWGVKGRHPLYESWCWMKRAAGLKGGMVARWRDFWLYVEDVGAPPEPRSRVYRIDPQEPAGPANFEWRIPILDVPKAADKARYARAWRAKRPHKTRQNDRKKLYGLKPGEYDQMLADQNGVCAICGKPETTIDPRYGESFSLAVDHNKVTKVNRGLLCMGCNTGIGCLDHSVPNLEAAIRYIEHHAAKPPLAPPQPARARTAAR